PGRIALQRARQLLRLHAPQVLPLARAGQQRAQHRDAGEAGNQAAGQVEVGIHGAPQAALRDAAWRPGALLALVLRFVARAPAAATARSRRARWRLQPTGSMVRRSSQSKSTPVSAVAEYRPIGM